VARALKGRVKAWALERGLVGHLTLFSKRFVNEGDSYFEQDPIRSVKFVKLNSDIGTVKPEVLFACPHMARIVKLDLDGSALKDANLTRLAASPCAPKLRFARAERVQSVRRRGAPEVAPRDAEVDRTAPSAATRSTTATRKALAKCPESRRCAYWTSVTLRLRLPVFAALVSGKHAPA